MKKELFWTLLILFGTTLLFFHPILRGQIPFPGDLLVGGYPPYNTNSYDGYAPGGVTNKAQGPDVIRQLLPWKYLSTSLWNVGQIPLWNPYNLSGTPLMANFQSGVFYPLNVLFLVLPFGLAWTVYIYLIPLLFGFFTYLFLRELSISKIPSIFSSITAAFSSYMVVWLEYGNVGHTFLWLPLILYLSEKMLKKFQLRYVTCIVYAFTFSFLGGYIQGYFYETVVFLVYFFGKLLTAKNVNFKRIILVGILLGTPLLFSMFQLLPTLELFSHSARNNYSLSVIEKLLNPVWYWITILVPNFFGHPAARNHWFYGTYIERVSYFGFIPFVFAVFSLTQFKKRKEIKIFGILFIASLLFATDLFVTKYFYLLPIPIISTTVPTRILSIFAFTGSILAGFGFEYFLKQEEKKKYWMVLGSVGAIIMITWAYALFAPNVQSEARTIYRNLVLPTLFLFGNGIFTVLYFSKMKLNVKRYVVIGGILLITVFDLFYFFEKITPFAPLKYLYPSTAVFTYLKQNTSINRIWGYGSGSIESNLTGFEKLYSPDGYDPLYPREYGEIVSTSGNGSIITARSEGMIQPGYGKEDLRKNSHRQVMLNLLGVKYVLDRSHSESPDVETFPKEVYFLIWHEGAWSIYENKQALPRVALFSDYVVEKNPNKVAELIHDRAFPLKEKLILRESIPSDILLKKDLNASVEIMSYEADKVVLKTSSTEDQLLFISDTNFPGWKVTIDGVFGKIYQADYSFRSVPIRKGNHEIVFSYEPDSFRIGTVISIVSVFAFLAFIFVLYVKKIRI